MNKLFIAVVALVFPTSIFAQQRITGTLLDAKTKPITGFPFAEKVRVYDSRIYFIYQMATGQTFTNLFSISGVE